MAPKKRKPSQEQNEIEMSDDKSYTIYGIYDFDEQQLIAVNLDFENLKLDYDLMECSSPQFEIVEFDVKLI